MFGNVKYAQLRPFSCLCLRNDESLRTLLVEGEAIVNSCPLTAGNLNDESMEALTPNHLLTMKSIVVLPPPGSFQEADVNCRKSW